MIVVVGSTGSTGVPLVKALRAAGHDVRATARDLARARALHGPDVELVRMDLEEPGTFGAALAGARSVYVAVGGATGTRDLVAAESRFIDAAKRAGVRHYVKVSGIDSRPDAPAEIQRMHGSIERHLRASGLAFTVLRPSFFMQNFLGLAPAIRAGALPLPTGGARAALIDARDIADVAAAVLTTPGHEGKTYTLTGPESLSHADAARVLGRVLGHAVDFQDLPGPAFEGALVGAGLPPWFAALLTDVYVQVFAKGLVDRATDDLRIVLGRPPRDLEAFARDHAAAFA